MKESSDGQRVRYAALQIIVTVWNQVVNMQI